MILPRIFFFAIVFLTLFVASCSDKYARNHLLEGEWHAVSWEVKGQPNNTDLSAVQFTFTLPKQYIAKMGDQEEKGEFYLDQNRLYTTGENQIEKKVGIRLPHPDTLVMEMNRAGTDELLTLVRQ